MATAAEVAQVRVNTGQNTDEVITDPEIAEIIDDLGSVQAASAEVWRRLAAEYAKLVDTKEAGAEHKWSELWKRAMEMADFWEKRIPVATGSTVGRARTIAITRV